MPLTLLSERVKQTQRSNWKEAWQQKPVGMQCRQETWQTEGRFSPVREECTVLIYSYTGTLQCKLPLSADKVEAWIVAQKCHILDTAFKWPNWRFSVYYCWQFCKQYCKLWSWFHVTVWNSTCRDYSCEICISYHLLVFCQRYIDPWFVSQLLKTSRFALTADYK